MADIIQFDGHDRILNLIQSDRKLVEAVPDFSSSLIIPMSEIEDFEDWPDPVQIKDQDGRGACFPAGTRIRMIDGSERNIEEIRPFDQILTAEGHVGRVVKIMARDADDGLFRLSLWGHGHLKATAEHPILTDHGYVPIAKLKPGDWVAMPRYLPDSKKFIHVANHLPKRVMITRAGKGKRNFNAPEGRTQIQVRLTSVPDVVELTPQAGRIFGLFLAEGRSDPSKIMWTFNKNEEKTLVANLVELLRSEWGVEAHLQFRPNNSINVVVYGIGWALLFESLCSNGSGNKTLHPDLTSAPTPFLESLLDGWLDGDGYARRNEIQGVTISKNLALGMFDIAQGLGRRPSIRKYHSSTYGTVKTRQPRWEVSMGSSGEDSYRCRMDDTHVWRKVRGVEAEDFEGTIFNLEVEGDNSYVAEGIGVHNCNGHSAALSNECVRFWAGHDHVPLSAWYIYAILCRGIDQGSSILDALNLVSSDGVAPESLVQYGIINPNLLTKAAHDAAGRFKVEVGAKVTKWEEIVSAIAQRKFLNISIRVGNGFNNLDADGCPGVGVGPGNHAVCVGGGIKTSKKWGKLIKMANSWGTNWGWKGYCWLSQKHIESGTWFEGYTVEGVVDDPLGNDNPPPILS